MPRSKKEKQKSIKDVEKEVLAEGAENELPGEEKPKDEKPKDEKPKSEKPKDEKPKEEEQKELPDMPDKTPLVDGKPPKTELDKQAVKVGEIFEDLKKVNEVLKAEKEKLSDLLKEEGRDAVVIKTVEGNAYDVGIDKGVEKIFIRKKKEDML